MTCERILFNVELHINCEFTRKYRVELEKIEEEEWRLLGSWRGTSPEPAKDEGGQWRLFTSADFCLRRLS